MYFFAKKIAALKSKIALNHGGVILNILLFNRFFKLSEKAVLKSGIKMLPLLSYLYSTT